MKIGLFVFLIAIFYSLCGSVYAFPKLSKVDSIDNLLNGSLMCEPGFENSAFANYTYKNDSPITNHVLSLIKIAQNNHEAEKEFKGFLFLGQLYLHKHNYPVAETYFLKARKKALNDKEFVISSIYLAKIKMEMNLYLKALELLRKSKLQITESKDSYLFARVLLEEGYCYTKLNKFEAAKKHYNKAYTIIEDNALRELYGEIFKHRGHLNYSELDYLNALANYYKGLEFFEQDTVIGNYAIILEYIGKIYFHQGNYNKALEYFEDAEILYSKIDNVKSLGMMNYQIASSYLELKNFESCSKYLDDGLTYFKSFNCYTGQTLINLKYAELFIALNQSDSAKVYLQKVSPIILQIKNGDIEYNYYEQKAEYFISVNNSDSALYFVNRAKGLDLSNIQNKIARQNLLANVYSHTGNYKEAFKHKSKASELTDYMNKKINSYEIKILQSELELSQKKVVIEYLTNERKIQDKTIEDNKATIERQKAFTIAGIIVSVFLALFIILLTTFLNQKRKDNRKLFVNNRRIIQQNEEIELQSQHLQEVNEELEKLSIIARETDNGIKIMNAKGLVVWVNEGYTKMHGYTLNDLKELKTLDLLGKQANIDIQQLVNVWYGDKQPISFESLNKTKDNCDIWVQTTLTPIIGENGKIDKMIAIDSDITMLKQAEKEILIKNQDITSSISYAKRIQEAMMTPFNILSDQYKNSFCFYKPKSIVSGDFYWMSNRHNKLVIACADSTGHGVPGAFMSMIGISFLNKIVNEKGFISPAIILNRMRMNIINHLHQNGSEAIASDGMDMSVITIDTKSNQLEFAGAMNPVSICRGDELIELKPDRMPVGFFDNEDRPFESTTINLQPNDNIYLYTDGYYDQFGGKSGSKMKSHRFKKILQKACKLGEKQQDFIEHEFNSWKGEHPQVDDVLVMGININ